MQAAMSTTSQPAARTPGRHAAPGRELTLLEHKFLRFRAAALLDRHAALMSSSSGAGPIDIEQAAQALLEWSRDALDVLREVTR